MFTAKNKSGRGGARPGAGRKPNDVREVRRLVEEYQVACVDEEGKKVKKPIAIWCTDKLVEAANDPEVSPQQVAALKYLMNQAIGTPRQTMQMEIRETDHAIDNIDAALAAADPKNAKKLSADT